MIAIVYPQFYGVGGIARYLDSFLSNLPPDHPPIYLITGDDNRQERSYPGVEIVHVSSGRGRFNLFVWGMRVRRLLQCLLVEEKIQLVNFHFPPLIPGLFLSSAIPVVMTVHSTYLGMSGRFYAEQYYPSEMSWLALKIRMWMESVIYRGSSRAIVLTEFGQEQVRSYGYKKPIAVIPNGVDIERFKTSDKAAKDIDVVFTGRIERLKGCRGMVDICRKLVERKNDISIFIVGFGDEEAWVREQLADLSDNVIMTGKVPFAEMIGYYSRSRVYVSTSYYEGLPGTCLEAMAMQLPAVVWDFLFYRGLVVEGETGALAAPNDFSGMTEKILHLLDNPQQAAALGRNGRALLESEYSWVTLAPQVLAVFSEEKTL